jgi:nitrate reductase gamma subunit
MTIFLYLVIYCASSVCALTCAVRIVMYARAPIHLRWELYPVPHEEPGRVKYGGSRYEKADWRTQPIRTSLAGELKFMIPEMLFLKGLREFNRKLWYRSFPFHFGLYLLIGTSGMLLLGAALTLLAPFPVAGAVVNVMPFICSLTGATGLFLAILGACGLLVRRLTDRNLRIYTTPGDLFNLLFFIVTLTTLAGACLLRSSSAPDMLAIAQGLLTWNTALNFPGPLAAGLFLAALLIAYIPMTHMSHFIAKYFTYHGVRWDDAPNPKGGKLETRLAQYLTYRPTWSAPHLGADGKKTWAQIATTNPGPEAKGER